MEGSHGVCGEAVVNDVKSNVVKELRRELELLQSARLEFRGSWWGDSEGRGGVEMGVFCWDCILSVGRGDSGRA